MKTKAAFETLRCYQDNEGKRSYIDICCVCLTRILCYKPQLAYLGGASGVLGQDCEMWLRHRVAVAGGRRMAVNLWDSIGFVGVDTYVNTADNGDSGEGWNLLTIAHNEQDKEIGLSRAFKKLIFLYSSISLIVKPLGTCWAINFTGRSSRGL